VPNFARVLIETTGLADPAPILHTLLADERINQLCRIDGIVPTAQHLSKRPLRVAGAILDRLNSLADVCAKEGTIKSHTIARR